MVIKNTLSKDDDTEFKKLVAVYTYAINNATSLGTAETQIQRIYNTVHGEENCAPILVNICQCTGSFDRLMAMALVLLPKDT